MEKPHIQSGVYSPVRFSTSTHIHEFSTLSFVAHRVNSGKTANCWVPGCHETPLVDTVLMEIPGSQVRPCQDRLRVTNVRDTFTEPSDKVTFPEVSTSTPRGHGLSKARTPQGPLAGTDLVVWPVAHRPWLTGQRTHLTSPADTCQNTSLHYGCDTLNLFNCHGAQKSAAFQEPHRHGQATAFKIKRL